MPSPHHKLMRTCLSLAERSPPRPTNFRLLSSGYTMELAGNTHAEQCCLSNYAAVHGVPDDRIAEVLPATPGRKLVMYVTMEPCGKRLSGNLPCVQRIIQTRAGGRPGIQKVYFGVKEPGTFVGQSEGCRLLTEAGIEWEVVQGLEREILMVATAGHENSDEEVRVAMEGVETNIVDVSDEERRRQDLLPRNPKKRMMEV
ncbi:cytidine and deoxycytidylate deaminase zinc-binding domain protein [Aspergillus heteromorphus CBS 117.55]|uniref:Cytidine and deoxycytidylate deaminase zinc-binding domain protein n=1 Tax=Aspergillus heteromorphus CBS 117.55 TaxID=1448321 RepID=A0A317VJ86_9EURO|nr:cytidine and deoxycytidylate deaminase zinc-binding domain protein [Aspergillus heteromorphus CBS 117.55]PWY74434.1 cytidine and deoxycytidylate deaminase zinc-binding domain protein [Aspergillus heteromorphus CBS 117.55]